MQMRCHTVPRDAFQPFSSMSALACISSFGRIFFALLAASFPATDTIDTKVNTHVLSQSTHRLRMAARILCIFHSFVTFTIIISQLISVSIATSAAPPFHIIHTFFHSRIVIQNSLKSIVRFEFPFFPFFYSILNEEC